MENVSDYKIIGNLWAIFGAAKNLHYLALTSEDDKWGEHLRYDKISDGITDWIDSFQETVLIPMTKDFQAWQDSVKLALEVIPKKPIDLCQGKKELRKLMFDTLELIDVEQESASTGSVNLYATTSQYIQTGIGLLGISKEISEDGED